MIKGGHRRCRGGAVGASSGDATRPGCRGESFSTRCPSEEANALFFTQYHPAELLQRDARGAQRVADSRTFWVDIRSLGLVNRRGRGSRTKINCKTLGKPAHVQASRMLGAPQSCRHCLLVTEPSRSTASPLLGADITAYLAAGPLQHPSRL
jgi:hypothetical protein